MFTDRHGAAARLDVVDVAGACWRRRRWVRHRRPSRLRARVTPAAHTHAHTRYPNNGQRATKQVTERQNTTKNKGDESGEPMLLTHGAHIQRPTSNAYTTHRNDPHNTVGGTEMRVRGDCLTTLHVHQRNRNSPSTPRASSTAAKTHDSVAEGESPHRRSETPEAAKGVCMCMCIVSVSCLYRTVLASGPDSLGCCVCVFFSSCCCCCCCCVQATRGTTRKEAEVLATRISLVPAHQAKEAFVLSSHAVSERCVVSWLALCLSLSFPVFFSFGFCFVVCVDGRKFSCAIVTFVPWCDAHPQHSGVWCSSVCLFVSNDG